MVDENILAFWKVSDDCYLGFENRTDNKEPEMIYYQGGDDHIEKGYGAFLDVLENAIEWHGTHFYYEPDDRISELVEKEKNGLRQLDQLLEQL